MRTLRAWDIRLDESLFLGGADKTQFLRAFGADVFFDDQAQDCEPQLRPRRVRARAARVANRLSACWCRSRHECREIA